MKVQYDPETDTLTIRLRNERIKESEEVRPGIIADYGYDGGIVRFEVLRASTVVERIDAALDRVFVLFMSGAWNDARDEALRTLGWIEETQGDRAAGGILFILAYLAADDGQWAHAAQRCPQGCTDDPGLGDGGLPDASWVFFINAARHGIRPPVGNDILAENDNRLVPRHLFM